MAVYLGNQKKRVKKGPALIGLIILICILGVGAAFFFGGNQEETPITPEQDVQVTETLSEQATGTLPSNAFPITVVTQ
ncbi:MAG: hypothetical protein ACRC6H_08395 [Culicoidibacterales bacterium]